MSHPIHSPIGAEAVNGEARIGAVGEADARTRTGDPFITSSGRTMALGPPGGRLSKLDILRKESNPSRPLPCSPFSPTRTPLSVGGRALFDTVRTQKSGCDPDCCSARTMTTASLKAGAAALAVDVKEYGRGRQHADEALTLHRELDDAWGIARSTFFLGYVAIESGDFAQARPHFENSLERFSALGAEHDVQLVLFNLSWACGELGDDERARELENECLRRARASGLPRDVAFGLDLQSTRARDDGRLDVALDAALESLRIRVDEGDVQHELDGLSRVAAIHARTDRMEASAQLLSSSLHLHEETGMRVPLYQEERNANTLALIRGQLDEPAFEEAWEHGAKMSFDEAIALALGEADEDADADFQRPLAATLESVDLPDDRAVCVGVEESALLDGSKHPRRRVRECPKFLSLQSEEQILSAQQET